MLGLSQLHSLSEQCLCKFGGGGTGMGRRSYECLFIEISRILLMPIVMATRDGEVRGFVY